MAGSASMLLMCVFASSLELHLSFNVCDISPFNYVRIGHRFTSLDTHKTS